MARADIKFATKMITSAMAQQLLTKNLLNRPLSKRHVDVLVGALKRGEWQLSGDTIKIDTNGNLIDGQHRLAAIVKSGIAAPLTIATGVAPEAFHVIDTGAKARGASDVLAISGESNNHVLAAALRVIKNWEVHGDMTTNSYTWTVAELEDVLKRHPRLREYSNQVVRHKIITPAFSCAFGYLFSIHNPEAATQFMSRLGNGAGLEQGNPILQLRDILMANNAARSKLPKKTIAALMVKAFNLYQTGKTVTRLTWDASQKFPVILSKS